MLSKYIAIMEMYKQLEHCMSDRYGVFVCRNATTAYNYVVHNMDIDIQFYSKHTQKPAFLNGVRDTIIRTENMAKSSIDGQYHIYMGAVAELQKFVKEYSKEEA
jgi:hypothetical protein